MRQLHDKPYRIREQGARQYFALLHKSWVYGNRIATGDAVWQYEDEDGNIVLVPEKNREKFEAKHDLAREPQPA